VKAEFQVIRAGQIIFKSKTNVDHLADLASGAQQATFAFVRLHPQQSLFDEEITMRWVKPVESSQGA